MDENKEKETGASQEELLKQELEELAKTFQEELDKAKAQEAERLEAEGELIQELEDVQALEEAEDEEIPEQELCECCGERRRGTKKNPDSPYCYNCEKALRHYPFELLNIIIPALAIAFCFYACYIFSNYSGVYTSAQLADKYASQNKLYTASAAYDTAAEKMQNKKINGEMVYKRAYECRYKSGMFADDAINTEVFKDWELKLPHMKTVYASYLESLEMDATQSAISAIFYEYGDEEFDKLPYDEIIKKIEALNDEPAKVLPLIDGETEEEISTTAPYNIKVQNYNRAMILYFEFYISAVCEKDYKTQISYLEKLREEFPEKTWIYAAMLGDLYNKTGKDINELYKQMKKVNEEDSTADVVKATSLRINGKYDEAMKLCDKFIDKEDTYGYEFMRQKAICCLLKNDYETAYKFAYEAYTMSTIPVTANTLMICSVKNNKLDTYEEVEKLFKESDMDISKEVLAVKDGSKSVEDIFMKGDFDAA